MVHYAHACAVRENCAVIACRLSPPTTLEGSFIWLKDNRGEVRTDGLRHDARGQISSLGRGCRRRGPVGTSQKGRCQTGCLLNGRERQIGSCRTSDGAE
eukprot:scaffold71515_cov32-Tisochrysis_lutea.AAC.5